ncbi:class I SAM-dependent methyltransferase [Salinibacter ruber]|uniref:class I SAM-dependent methyltransferase n=1 Tax=Salinibacter ruber TaxID=146919 RepID=UPI00216A64CD|nr:class I SAM-dependent methyltransferase [Salinibacter ruber]MCS4058437.1 2-polyprenyl-3-methyl-5-hydroxy-6-metoxy-1,4-benzoquinol methylase [Salinibacter ruber]
MKDIENENMVKKEAAQKVYTNSGNDKLISYLSCDCEKILDVGCGAGDNAILIRQKCPSSKVFGITISEKEKEKADNRMHTCWLCDVEKKIPKKVRDKKYDAIIFSHVLEHLRSPSNVLNEMIELLRSGGEILIAVPNVLRIENRLKLLCGKWEYENTGIMDNTHLRFFTYYNAYEYLLKDIDRIDLVTKRSSGHFPLGPLRQYVFPKVVSGAIDGMALNTFPNLFSIQIILKAKKSV